VTEVKDSERYVVKLDIFEGPLDLLLHLISKHELDIFDIPISFITAEYLKYLDLMKELNLDLASDYLEMAATLALIKSKMLVPSDPAGDEEDPEVGPDPREELVKRLLEYQKYKTAAMELMERPLLGRDTFARGTSEAFTDERELSSPGLFALMEAFQKLISKTDFDTAHNVTIIRISISDRINEIVDVLRVKKRMTFYELFAGQHNRSDLVVTFISLLEMCKLGISHIHQAESDGEIYISASEAINDQMSDLLKNLEEEEE
jgi:segregation and condensation protein A